MMGGLLELPRERGLGEGWSLRLLTAREEMECRREGLELAAEGDFVLCLYNPASRRRPDTLRQAAALLLRHRSPDTPCGLARRVGRPGEEAKICTLRELGEQQADMFTTVFVGSSQTRVINGRLVTPRGY